MNTLEYLKRNNLSIETAIYFTNNDLEFIDKYKLSSVDINSKKDTKETLSRNEILQRLVDLYRILNYRKVSS